MIVHRTKITTANARLWGKFRGLFGLACPYDCKVQVKGRVFFSPYRFLREQVGCKHKPDGRRRRAFPLSISGWFGCEMVTGLAAVGTLFRVREGSKLTAGLMGALALRSRH